MTTHLRGRAVQAGAFLALVIGGIAVAPAIALANPPGVQITDLSPTEVASGGKVTMRYTVANTNLGEGGNTSADIKVNGMSCSGDCGQLVTIDQGANKQFTANLTAPTVPDGQNQQVQIQIRATINGETGNATATVNVKGDDKPQTVRQISGKIKDQDNKAISGAQVLMQDSAGNRYNATSNGSGGYTFTSSDSDPIVPGKVTIGAAKDGFQARSVDVQASAGRSVTASIVLKAIATASPSPSESPSASPSATTPADNVTETAAPEAPIPSATTPTNNAAATQNNDSGSTLFIILGALLVAAGIGAIVLVMMRRKSNGGDDPDGFDGPGGVGPLPSGPGRYGDPTRVGAPMGAGPADATMVAPMSGAPSISDAPTMLHRPVPAVDDEFPDPYGVPIPQQGGYAGTNNWDNQPAGYGTEAAQYGAGAYGPGGQYVPEPGDDPYAAYNAAPSGGYGAAAAPAAQRRYDEPTGMYRPDEAAPDAGYAAGPAGYDPQDGYGGQYAVQPEPTGTYGAYGSEQPVDDQAGYGSWGAPGGGYAGDAAAGGAYGGAQQPQYGGGYAAEPAGGYAEPTGYDQQGAPYGGYEQHEPAYGEPGYDPRPRHGGQPPQRRPPEWDN